MKQKHPFLCSHWISKKENVPLEEYQVLSVYVLKAIFPGLNDNSNSNNKNYRQ